AALRPDGTLWTWGLNPYGELGDGTSIQRNAPVRIFGSQQWVAVWVGALHTLGLDSQGQVWTWGQNTQGYLGDGTTAVRNRPTLVPGLTNVVAISAGGSTYAGFHSLAVKADGTVWAWGANAFGQLGNGTTTPSLTPVQVPGLTGISQVVAGLGFSVALKTDGAAGRAVYPCGVG